VAAAGPNVGAIVGFAFAAVGVVGAAVFGPLTLSTDGSLHDSCGAMHTCTPGQLSDLHTWAALTDGSFGLALAGAIVGGLFLLIDGVPGESHTAALRVAPLATSNAAGIAASGTF
jgi:hypothetical protein